MRSGEPLIDLPARRPRAALWVATLATIGALALMIVRLRPETTIQGLLDQSDPAVAAMGRVLEHFPVADELLVLATLPDDAPADDAAELLTFVQRLEAAVERDADAKQVISHVRYRAGPQARAFVEKVIVPNAVYYLTDEQLEEALHRLTPEAMRQQLARNEALLSAPGPAAGALAKTIAKDPLRLHEFLLERLADLALPGAARPGGPLGPGANDAFLSPDGRSLLIRIGGTRPPGEFEFSTRLMRDVARFVRDANVDQLRIDITGGYAIAAHSASRIRFDSIVGTVSSVLGLAALFAIIYRRPGRSFVLAFVPIAAGLIWGFGVYAILRRTITPLAAVVGGALGGIGIDYTIHYLTRYHDVRRGVTDPVPAAAEATRLVFRPLVAAWFTSVIGFAAIAVSPVPVLRDFSLLGTLCLIGVWLATIGVLPAMLVLRDRADDQSLAHRVPVAPRLGQWMARRTRAILIVSCAILAATIAYVALRASPYDLEPDVMTLHPQPSPPLEAQRFIAQRMEVSAGAVLIHVNGDSPDQLVTRSHEVQQRLRTDAVRAAGVSGVFGLASLLPEAQLAARRRASLDPQLPERAANDLRAALRDSSFNPDAYSAYITFLQRLIAPGPPPDLGTLVQYPEMAQLLLPRQALSGASSSEAVVLVFFRSPLEKRVERDAAVNAIRAALKDLAGVSVTGMAPIGTDVDRTIHRDLPRLIGVAFAVITLYLLVHFRSLKLAIVAMIPTAISGLCLVAFMTLTGMRLNLVNIVMAPILLGINVDYGIFVAHAWRTSRSVRELLRQFDPLVTAMLTCGGTTIIGFGSLVLTSIPAVRSLGWLINAGVIACMLATLFVLWTAMMAVMLRALPLAPYSGGNREAVGEGTG
jgi:predicted RND superfamily exporter protein